MVAAHASRGQALCNTRLVTKPSPNPSKVSRDYYAVGASAPEGAGPPTRAGGLARSVFAACSAGRHRHPGHRLSERRRLSDPQRQAAGIPGVMHPPMWWGRRGRATRQVPQVGSDLIAARTPFHGNASDVTAPMTPLSQDGVAGHSFLNDLDLSMQDVGSLALNEGCGKVAFDLVIAAALPPTPRELPLDGKSRLALQRGANECSGGWVRLGASGVKLSWWGGPGLSRQALGLAPRRVSGAG